MPLGLNFKRKLVGSNRTFSVQVKLPDETVIDDKLPSSAKGADCLRRLCKIQRIEEIQYFGLQYVNRRNLHRWIDPDKSLRKQLDHHSHRGRKPTLLYLKVRFFVPSCESIHQEFTRYLYYLELKNKITSGELPCSLETALRLGSLAVQAEFGDFDEQKHTLEFLQDFVLLPASASSQLSEGDLNEKISELHRSHRGMTPSAAEIAYLRECQQLEDYGIEFFSVKDKEGKHVNVGASFMGVLVSDTSGGPPYYFQWQNIANMAYNRHFFCVENGSTAETIQFDASDIGSAKYIWKSCVAQHQFYRLSYASASSPLLRLQSEIRSDSSSSQGSPAPAMFQRKPTLPRKSAKRKRLVNEGTDPDDVDGVVPRLALEEIAQRAKEGHSIGQVPWQPRLEADDDASSTPGQNTPVSSGYSTSDSETESDTSSRVHPVAGPIRLTIATSSGGAFRQRREPESRDRLLQQLERVIEDDQLYSEFEQIFAKKMNGNVNTGSLVINSEKNRTKDILPYEENRVRLDPARNPNQNDYINASLVKMEVGKGQTLSFIATQGPLQITVADFWQMIWEQRVNVIVMTTFETQNNRAKSCQYWPADEAGSEAVFEEYNVSTQFITKSDTFITRGLRVTYKRTSEERTVIQTQFIAWPDVGIPEKLTEFLNFLDEVRGLNESLNIMDENSEGSSMVVHCSTGAGRTGVFILCEVVIAMIENNQYVDIPMILARLRSQRMHMVQTVTQYSFVYAVILAFLKRSRLI